MPDLVDEFFEGLGSRRDRVLEHDACLEVDLVDSSGTDRWYVLFGKGWAQASRGPHEAETVIEMDRHFFEQAIRGEAEVMAGWLRNQVRVTGDVYLLDLFRRLLPGRAGARDPRIRPEPAAPDAVGRAADKRRLRTPAPGRGDGDHGR